MSRIIAFPLAVIALFCLVAPGGAQLPPPVGREVDFAREVHPILVKKCLRCHTGEQAEAGLNLAKVDAMLEGGDSGPAVRPGNSAGSLLIARVSGEIKPLMPFGGEPLSAEEIGVLRAWIDQGAEWDPNEGTMRKTAGLAPRQPEVPEAALAGSRHPVDRFVAAYFDQKGIETPEPVSGAAFLRRAYLDLWGFAPPASELQRFVESEDPDKRQKLVDRLLEHDEYYAGHWMSFWNDLLRNEEGVVYHGQRKSITDWLHNALKTNRAYDQMVRDLLNPEDETGPDGFLMGVTWRGVVNASQRPPMQAAQNSAQVFLGINLKCASCHDSFINQWKLRDSYGLASLFSEEPLELVRCDVELGETAEPKFLFPELGKIEPGLSQQERREEAARLFTTPENGRLARTMVNRYWKKLLGTGLVEPPDDMDVKAWNQDLLDWLATDFADHGYDLKHLLRRLMTSKTYQLPAVPQEQEPFEKYVFQGPDIRRMGAEQFMDSISAITGAWRVEQAREGWAARRVREWRMKSSPLSRSLGRAVRDQVITERNQKATTLQALELVNGETLARLLENGAKRMLGREDPAPPNLFDSGTVGFRNTLAIEADISGAEKLYLLTRDTGSYDPAKVIAAWADVKVIREDGTFTPLEKLKELGGAKPAEVTLDGVSYDNAFRGGVPGEYVFDIAGEDFVRLHAVIGAGDSTRTSVIYPQVRFFVFGVEPNRRRLTRIEEDFPVDPMPVPERADALVERLYLSALGRPPSETEREIADEFLASAELVKDIPAAGLEDLLWSLFMLPEFQYIR